MAYRNANDQTVNEQTDSTFSVLYSAEPVSCILKLPGLLKILPYLVSAYELAKECSNVLSHLKWMHMRSAHTHVTHARNMRKKNKIICNKEIPTNMKYFAFFTKGAANKEINQSLPKLGLFLNWGYS